MRTSPAARSTSGGATAAVRALTEGIGADYTFAGYLAATREALFMRDIVTGLVKSIVFGLVITGVGFLIHVYAS